MKCRIFRDFDTDNVIKVLNKNGEESVLYKEALKETRNEEAALDIWATSFLPSFNAFIKDAKIGSNEPKLKDVLTFINNLNTTRGLYPENIAELSNNLQGLNVNSPDDLLNNLQRTFFNKSGIFSVERTKLKNSKLYSDSEINHLMTFPTGRAQVREFINRLRNTLQSDTDLTPLFVENSTQEDFIIQDGTTLIGLGKFKIYNQDEVIQYAIDRIPSFTTNVDFISKIQTFKDPTIRNAILDNEDIFNTIKDTIKNSVTLPVYTDLNGFLVPEMNNDLSTTLYNTLQVGEDSTNFSTLVGSLYAISENSWYNDRVAHKLLWDIQLEAAKHHIDLTGLINQFSTKTKEEVIGILDVVDEFLNNASQGNIATGAIYDLSTDLSEFFDTVSTPKTKGFQLGDFGQGRNLINLETSRNKLDVYKTEGYIEVKENIYQKVKPFDTFSELVDETYNSMLEDITILPDRFLESIKLKTGEMYNINYLTNPKNKSKIISNIDEVIIRNFNGILVNNSPEEYDSNKQIELYKQLLQIPESIDTFSQTPENFINRKHSVEISEAELNYLTSDFISDFYTKYLTEKVLDNTEFSNVYSKFKITNKGIIGLSNNLFEQGLMKVLLQNDSIGKELSKYAVISKSPTLEFLIPESSSNNISDIKDRRDYAINFPESVVKLDKPFTRVDSNTIITHQSINEFVKITSGVYELTNYKNGVSMYSKINTVVDPNFNVFNMSEPMITTGITLETFEETNTSTNLMNNSKVTQTQVSDLLDEFTC